MNVIEAWNNKVKPFETFLVENGFTFLGSGRCNNVYVGKDKTYVVKMNKPDGLRLDFSCYKKLRNYNPDNIEVPVQISCSIGSSSDEKINNDFKKIRRIFMEHVLYPIAVSNDYRCCVQKYLTADKDKITRYFSNLMEGIRIPRPTGRNTGLQALGPFENLAWDEAEQKGMIIDIW